MSGFYKKTEEMSKPFSVISPDELESLQKEVDSFSDHYSYINQYTNDVPIVHDFFKLYNNLMDKIQGRKDLESIRPFVLLINDRVAYSIAESKIEFVTSGFWFWKSSYIQTKEKTYDANSDKLCEFRFEIVFDDKEERRNFENKIKEKKIHSLHLKYYKENMYKIED